MPSHRTILSSSEEELNSGTSPSESNSTSKEATPNSQNSREGSGHGEFRVVKHDHGHRAAPSPLREEHIQPQRHQDEIIRALSLHNCIVLNPPIDLVPQTIHVHDIVLQPEPPQEVVVSNLVAGPSTELVQPSPMSREECKQHAYEEARTLFQTRNETAQPPEPMPAVNGLYVLITETEEQWVPNSLLDDPDGCMQYLHKQLEDGTIGTRIGSAFGQWYLYGNAKVLYYVVIFISSACSVVMFISSSVS